MTHPHLSVTDLIGLSPSLKFIKHGLTQWAPKSRSARRVRARTRLRRPGIVTSGRGDAGRGNSRHSCHSNIVPVRPIDPSVDRHRTLGSQAFKLYACIIPWGHQQQLALHPQQQHGKGDANAHARTSPRPPSAMANRKKSNQADARNTSDSPSQSVSSPIREEGEVLCYHHEQQGRPRQRQQQALAPLQQSPSGLSILLLIVTEYSVAKRSNFMRVSPSGATSTSSHCILNNSTAKATNAQTSPRPPSA